MDEIHSQKAVLEAEKVPRLLLPLVQTFAPLDRRGNDHFYYFTYHQ